MSVIYLKTEINAPIEVCFDLSRSIDFHKISTGETKEEAIAGVTSGLINLHESVTWRAKHLGFKQNLTSKITAFEKPNFFVDEQTKGIFKSMKHLHQFEHLDGKTIMTDVFEFHSPFGIIGKIFNKIFLTNYMRNFLLQRNQLLKECAENGTWKEFI